MQQIANRKPRNIMYFILVLVGSLSLALCAKDLNSSYRFSVVLHTAEDGGLYELYWKFDNAAETISFAVRVQTTGWVGFGLSPNGQMPDSDVVIGWVTHSGETMFQDRFAAGRAPPTVDEQQDWVLEGGEEDDGFTVLRFSRKYVTCDAQDLPIKAETARVIWSFHATADPPSQDIPRSLVHSKKGSKSLNLLGGLPSPAPDPEDIKFFDVGVNSIIIPKNDTTYWCSVSKIPQELHTQTGYITKFAPLVTKGNEAHVHHLVVTLCTGLNDSHVGNGEDCGSDIVAFQVEQCQQGIAIAAWAVGGEIFVYPDNVAYPFGGEGYMMIELHYDNPKEIEGTRDSSGMRIWYTTTPREHDAGILAVGHSVHPYQVIPPNSETFVSLGIMTEECTNKYLPPDGIHVFANFFHTHLAGHGLTLQHIRYNSECGVYEELEPVDSNLKYDFDYQQFTHLKHEVIIKPGDILQLKCFYRTQGIDTVTLGGFSTREEMCLASLVYYPRQDVIFSVSQINENEYNLFLSTVPAGKQILNGEIGYEEGLNKIEWDDNDMRGAFQRKLNESNQDVLCGVDFTNFIYRTTKLPQVGCSYVAPDQCSNSTVPSCCERISAVEDSGVTLRLSPLTLLLVLPLVAWSMG